MQSLSVSISAVKQIRILFCESQGTNNADGTWKETLKHNSDFIKIQKEF